jgi:hypothetical protein
MNRTYLRGKPTLREPVHWVLYRKNVISEAQSRSFEVWLLICVWSASQSSLTALVVVMSYVLWFSSRRLLLLIDFVESWIYLLVRVAYHADIVVWTHRRLFCDGLKLSWSWCLIVDRWFCAETCGFASRLWFRLNLLVRGRLFMRGSFKVCCVPCYLLFELFLVVVGRRYRVAFLERAT